MKIKYEMKDEFLQNIVNFLSNVSVESKWNNAVIQLTKNKFNVYVLNKSGTMMTRIFFDNAMAFDSINEEGFEESVFEVKTLMLKKALYKLKQENVWMEYDGAKITVGNKKTKYVLDIYDTDPMEKNQATRNSNLIYNTKIKMKTKDFFEPINEATILDPELTVWFEKKENKISLVAEAKGSGKIKSLYENIEYLNGQNEDFKSGYSLPFLMCANYPEEELIIEINSAYPLRLNYKDEKGLYSMHTIIAPRVEND